MNPELHDRWMLMNANYAVSLLIDNDDWRLRLIARECQRLQRPRRPRPLPSFDSFNIQARSSLRWYRRHLGLDDQ